MLRIAHVSDTHVLSTRGVEWHNMLFNKRLTGQANLLLHRGRVHRRESEGSLSCRKGRTIVFKQPTWEELSWHKVRQFLMKSGSIRRGVSSWGC